MNLADCLSRCDQWDLVSYIEVKWLSWRHCCPLLFLLLLLLLPAFLYTAGHLPLYSSHLIGCHYSSRPGLITAGLQHETYWLTRGCNLTPLALNPPLTSPFSKLQLDCRRVINAPPPLLLWGSLITSSWTKVTSVDLVYQWPFSHCDQRLVGDGKGILGNVKIFSAKKKQRRNQMQTLQPGSVEMDLRLNDFDWVPIVWTHTILLFLCYSRNLFFFFQNVSEGKIDLIPENICWYIQFNNMWIFVPNLQSWSWNSALSAAK